MTYVGHSMGSMAALMLLTVNSSYDEKLKPVILMAPCAYMQYTDIPFKNIIDWEISKFFPGSIGQRSGLLNSRLDNIGRQFLCGTPGFRKMCIILFSILFGDNSEAVDIVSVLQI